MIGLWWMVAAALGAECETMRFPDIAAIEAPAVIVLGERHGHAKDLRRADKLVGTLARTAPVRVALEAVHRKYQPILDRFAAGKLRDRDLPELLAWDESWGFAWRPYRGLVTAHMYGASVVAAGLDLGKAPEGAEFPVPPRYLDLLRPMMGDHPMPIGMEGRFVQSMAWRDFGIASRAAEGWDGKGYLVVVTGRGHVEGGKGVTWQLERLVDAPIHGITLVAGPDPTCHPGDVYWK